MTSGISEKERLIEAIKNSGCITYGERTGTSGQKLYYFINLEKLTDGNNTGSLYLAKAVAGLILNDERKRDCRYKLLGVKGGGHKVAKHVRLLLDRDVIGVDPHSGSIDKLLAKTETYAFVEDVTTTGSSIEKCFRLASSLYDVRPKVAFSVVDRNNGASDNLSRLGLELQYIVDAKNDLGLVNAPKQS